MSFVPPIADPLRRLSLAYAPASRRHGLALLYALDEKLGGIVTATREAALGEIRLAWWRERLAALPKGAPAGEPILQGLAPLVADGTLGADRLSELADGWAVLLEPLPLGEEALHRFAEGRGAMLFEQAARLLGSEGSGVADAGAGWALADLSRKMSDAATARAARDLAAPRLRIPFRWWLSPLRPLALLTWLARRG